LTEGLSLRQTRSGVLTLAVLQTYSSPSFTKRSLFKDQSPRPDDVMTQLTQLIVQGISSGAIYGLVALGLVLSYKATEVLNFAQGDVVMLSAFLGWGLVVAVGLPFWLSFVVVLCIAAALCFLLEAKIMRRIVGRPGSQVSCSPSGSAS